MLKPLVTALLLLSCSGPASACTAFCASGRGLVLVGNNEDYFNPQTRIWFVPAKAGVYGRLYVGFSDMFPQGGMNEKGVFFDGFAIQEALPPGPPARGKKPFGQDAMDKLMGKCATVEEVIRFLGGYDLSGLDHAVLMFADATGDSAVVDGHGALRKTGWYQIQTNFRQWQVKPEPITCERYKLAKEMLDQSGGEISIDLARRILAATHAERPAATLYSNIYDLKNRVMYLYHFHNFENVRKFDLREELKKGAKVYELPSLFPKTVAAEVFARERAKQEAAK